ncbi:MAG TPA: GNAT family N-acetyltransferase [Methylomirabilota bacterium]|nr:GNAT family N-acetyltransferase [Methylomirabilota bacterium]
MSGGIVLRDVAEGGLPTFHDHQLDPDATRMAAFPSWDREVFMDHWTRILADETVTAKTILVDGQVAGNIVCWVEVGDPLVDYWIGRDFWGKGAATAELAAFLEHIAARPLYARVALRNLASIRVLEKSGFIKLWQDAIADLDGEVREEAMYVLR